MAKKDEYRKKFEKALQKENLKLTSQRSAIFDEVIYGKKHRECEEICVALKKKNIMYQELPFTEHLIF